MSAPSRPRPRAPSGARSPLRRMLGMLALVLASGFAVAAPPPTAPAARPDAAASARDTSFAALVARLSEPGGYFDTDNLISNEASYLHVAGKLRELQVSDGAYLGVGPDQNFSYIARVRPRIALLVDIRRDNLLQHLLFKALFELADHRADYLGLLLGRPAPPERPGGASIEQLVAHFEATPQRRATLDSAHARVRERLRDHGVPLSEADLATIRRIHETFAREGLGLRFQSHGRAPQFYYPSLRELLLERDLQGRHASYLADEADYRFVRDLQRSDRVVPVVGDLAGDHALPAIGRLLRERGIRVAAFYTSNVEYYLAGDGRLDAFVQNVRGLPRHPHGVIIRSVFRYPHPQRRTGYRSVQLLQPMEVLLQEYAAGRIRGYPDLVTVGALDLR